MLDAVLPEGGGRKLAFDKRLGAEENGTGRGDLAAIFGLAALGDPGHPPNHSGETLENVNQGNHRSCSVTSPHILRTTDQIRHRDKKKSSISSFLSKFIRIFWDAKCTHLLLRTLQR